MLVFYRVCNRCRLLVKFYLFYDMKFYSSQGARNDLMSASPLNCDSLKPLAASVFVNFFYQGGTGGLGTAFTLRVSPQHRAPMECTMKC